MRHICSIDVSLFNKVTLKYVFIVDFTLDLLLIFDDTEFENLNFNKDAFILVKWSISSRSNRFFTKYVGLITG